MQSQKVNNPLKMHSPNERLCILFYSAFDTQPSLGMLTVNALAAADSVIIPVQAQYLPAKGLEQLLQTISKVRKQINPKLQIDGILLTMVDNRTNFAKDISTLLRDTYTSHVYIISSFAKLKKVLLCFTVTLYPLKL